MTRDSYQQFWYTGVVLITKLDHYFTVSVNLKIFWAFEIIPNPRDTAPLTFVGFYSFFVYLFICFSRVRGTGNWDAFRISYSGSRSAVNPLTFTTLNRVVFD